MVPLVGKTGLGRAITYINYKGPQKTDSSDVTHLIPIASATSSGDIKSEDMGDQYAVDVLGQQKVSMESSKGGEAHHNDGAVYSSDVSMVSTHIRPSVIQGHSCITQNTMYVDQQIKVGGQKQSITSAQCQDDKQIISMNQKENIDVEIQSERLTMAYVDQ